MNGNAATVIANVFQRDREPYRAGLLRRRQDPLRQPVVRYDDRLGAAIPQHMTVILDPVGDIGRNRNRASRHNGEIGDRPFRA